MDRARLMTVPNTVSMSRLVLAVAFLLTTAPLARVAIIVVAGATDFLDGFLARIGNSATSSGALIDPVADRVFVLAAVSSYLVDGLLTSGQYFIFISRDLATAVGFLVARVIPWLRPIVFRARLLGKAVTVLQLATMITVLLFPRATAGLIVAIGLLSAMSIIDYTFALWRARAR